MDESQKQLVKVILDLNRLYDIQPDIKRGFKREGEKERVDVQLRVFNGQPQIAIFYGKVRYTYNLVSRKEPNNTAALMALLGYKGVDAIPPDLLADFNKEAVAMRKEMLRERGV